MTRKRPAPWSPGIRKVLAHIREKRGEWFIDANGGIRRTLPDDDIPACPISSMQNVFAGQRNTLDIARQKRIGRATEIMDVADGRRRGRLRAAMLRAAGLKEQR